MSFGFLLFGLLIAAMITDILWRRIPNALPVAIVVTGVAYQYLEYGWSGLGAGAIGVIVSFVTLFALFSLGGIGGGDVKLISSLAMWLSPISLAASVVIGVGLAVVVVSIQLMLRKQFKAFWTMLFHRVFVDRQALLKPDADRIWVPLGAYVSMGVIVVWVCGIA